MNNIIYRTPRNMVVKDSRAPDAEFSILLTKEANGFAYWLDPGMEVEDMPALIDYEQIGDQDTCIRNAVLMESKPRKVIESARRLFPELFKLPERDDDYGRGHPDATRRRIGNVDGIDPPHLETGESDATEPPSEYYIIEHGSRGVFMRFDTNSGDLTKAIFSIGEKIKRSDGHHFYNIGEARAALDSLNSLNRRDCYIIRMPQGEVA